MDAGLPVRRSFLAPVWAVVKIQGYWAILQIRESALISWATSLVGMLLARQLWIALFNGQATYEGFTLDETLTYVVLSMALNNLLKGDEFIAWKIRSGNVLFDLIYPLRFTTNLLFFSLSSLVTQLLTTGAPLVLMAVFLLRIPLLASPAAWLAFAASFLLGCLIFYCTEILASLLGFWTTEIHGVFVWREILSGFLSGAYLPLWVFPSIVQQGIAWLPFRGMRYVPLAILVGWIPPEQYLREMVIQLAWVVVLWLAVEGLFLLATHRVDIQGG